MRKVFAIEFLSATLISLPSFAAQTHKVVIEGMKFNPQSLSIPAGDSVVWINNDIVPHTATGKKKEFDSGTLSSSKNWKMIFRKAGQIDYVCSFHPTMTGIIVVR